VDESSVVREFVLETTHVLQTVEQDLLSLEKGPDPAALARVFRSLHSIKGSSSFLELAAIERLSHHAETLLDLLRRDRRVLTPPMADALLKCVDLLRDMVGREDFGQGVDIEPTVALLERFTRKDDAPAAIEPPLAPAPVVVAPRTAVAEISPDTTRTRVGVIAPAHAGNGSVAAPARAPEPPPQPLSALVTKAPEPEPAEEDKLMRVRVKFLDDLLQLTGNMVMARNQLLAKYDFAADPAFVTLSQCVTEVHKTIVQTRMNPIGALFDRCERLVRDVARQLGREVKLETSGRDLELDRSVLEAFADPLTHLIRNGVDHGLESAIERQAAGKPKAGLLKLTAREQSGEVILSLEDDGRGIDPDRVKEKAVAKGIVSAGHAAGLTRRGVLDLLFHAGFSTRDEVTALSGRGVGLDVVRNNVEKLGGVVEVDSVLGRGTTFTARIPLTQALVSSSLISALVVTSGGERYAIPQTAVDEIIRVSSQDDRDRLRLVNGRWVYRLRDQVLPVVPLADVLGAPASDGAEARLLVVMQFRGNLFGLRVDAILGVEEIVVRPLPELVRHCGIFTGHTVMGDGRVALILDGNGIITHQKLAFADDDGPAIGQVAERVDGPQRLVVFNFAADERFAIPLEMVSYIEKISTAAIKKVGSREFVQVNQRTMPVMRLDKVMGVSAMPAYEDAHLIIPARVNYPIAVLAGQSVVVADVAEQYESRLSDGRGMLGTFMHRGDLVMLLDLYHLFEKHSPEQFRSRPLELQPAHVLLAEDSPFFQNLIKSYLENPPRKLTVVGDGKQAWDLLQAHPEEFDILVTDIEMPEMDGFELVKRVRHDPQLRGLPVIAVTSLATPEHIERGLREGFDSYLVKIDKEELIKTMDKHLGKSPRPRAVAKGGARE